MCLLAADGREVFVLALANLPRCELPAQIFICQQRRTHRVCIRIWGGKGLLLVRKYCMICPPGFIVCDELYLVCFADGAICNQSARAGMPV